jgi:hypothetical protein
VAPKEIVVGAVSRSTTLEQLPQVDVFRQQRRFLNDHAALVPGGAAGADGGRTDNRH